MSKSKIFLIFCIAFIVGVFLGRFIGYEIMAIAAMVFIIVGTVWWNNKVVFILSIAGVLLLVGTVRFKTDYAQNDLAQFYGKTQQVTGVVSAEPDVRTDKTYLTLSHLVINQKAVSSSLLLTVGPYSNYEYGQKLQFVSKIGEPKEYPDFSYKNYLSRFGIDAVAYMPKIDVIPGNFGNPIMTQILKVKQKFVAALAEVLNEPQNSFLGGLLLGSKHSIPQTLTDEFNRTGTSHIVAISGYNITIIAAAISWILQWIGVRKKVSFSVSVLAIVLFVFMTGASASAVRAGIMGILLLLALNIGRVSVAANALAFTAMIMLVINPQILAFDVGFQLSFAAILGIVYLTPVLEPYFLWLPQVLRQYFLATLSAQIFTLPILVYNFGQLSLVALLPNLLVLPFVPITMLAGFLTGLVALISAKLAIPFALIAWWLLTYILGVIEFFANLKFATVAVTFSFFWLAFYYLVLCLILFVYYYKDSIPLNFTKFRFFGKLNSLIRQRRTDEAK